MAFGHAALFSDVNDLRTLQSLGHIVNDRVDSAFKALVCDAAGHRERRDNQYVFG